MTSAWRSTASKTGMNSSMSGLTTVTLRGRRRLGNRLAFAPGSATMTGRHRQEITWMSKGKLVVVGTGIRVAQLTPEARTYIETAEVVLHGVYDPATAELIQRLQPESESLLTSYSVGRLRTDTYAEMIERILAPVRQGRRVCVALYGHPGIFVYPSHAAIARARHEGHEARMLPAVSSL